MLEIRAAGTLAGSGRHLSGYAAVFNVEADLGEFRERIRPGAFATSLKKNEVRALYNHDGGALLGNTRSGTLKLNEDGRGLAFQLDLPDTSIGRDVAELVKRGDLAGCSFGFLVRSDQWTPGDKPTRELIDIDLREVTLTADPAYADTSIAMRALDKVRMDAFFHNPATLWLKTV